MASAALAYKCMEVAYMRIIYSNHFIASSDRHELQMTLQRVSPGKNKDAMVGCKLRNFRLTKI
jgi:hypothetical protein